MKFPYPTLIINVTGSLLLGWLTRSLGGLFPNLGPAPFLLLGTGLCGAYTTFSTFSYESLALFREKRVLTGLGYIIFSFIFGFAFSGLGLYGIPHR